MLRKVKTVNGWVEGIPAADPRITAFKGIPFAAPPVGENRWRAPQPAENWEGVKKCYAFAPISVQAVPGLRKDNIYTYEWNVDPEIPMSEDCLYLNVWTPAKKSDEKLPVYVWFFGGGLQVGNPAEMEFDGERLARRGIILVSVNYRVNVFGFLTTEEIAAAQPDAPANWGMLDQQAGLKWVRDNIEAFGGDPGNVTIGGQSAGGGSVMAHLTSPQSRGLFHKVIVESGVFRSVYGNYMLGGGRRDITAMFEQSRRFLEFIGAKNIAEARAMDAFYIRDKFLEFKGAFGTVADGQFSFGDPFTLYMEGKKANVPMLAGLTSDEFPNFFPEFSTKEEFEAKAKEIFGEKAEEFIAIAEEGAEDLEALREKTKSRPIELALRAMFEKDGGENANYMYYFDTKIPGPDHPGNFHSVDLWFFFETLAKCWRPFKGAHYDEARVMCNYWANFVKTGDPNGKDADGSEMPRWEAYTNDAPYYIRLSDQGIEQKKEPVDKLVRFLTDRIKEEF